jgi:hypothetical protein
MNNTTTKGKTLNSNESHHSDGSELIPAEIQANIRRNKIDSLDASFANAYTTDDEGLINNFAIEPDIYGAEYPSLRQQRRYVFLGAGASLLVIMLLLIAFFVS